MPERQLILAARVTDQILAVRTERQRRNRVARMGWDHLAFVLAQLVDGQMTVAGAD